MKLSRTTRTSHVLTTTLTNQPSPTTQPNLTTQLITTYSPLIMQYVMYLVPTPCGVTAFVNYAAVSGVSFVPSFIVIMLLSSLSLPLPVLRSLSFSTLSTLLFSVQLAFLASNTRDVGAAKLTTTYCLCKKCFSPHFNL